MHGEPTPGASYAAVHQLLLVGLVQLACNKMGGYLETLPWLFWHGVMSECTYIFIDGEDESEQSFNSFQFVLLFQKNQKIFSSRNRPGCFEGMVQSYTPDVGLVLTMIFQVNVNGFF